MRGIPKKLKISRNIVLKTHEDIKLLLDDEPHHLSLEWLCKMVSQEIMDRQVKETRNVYLVDLMPNLKFMLKNEHLVKEDCAAAINEFEAKVIESVILVYIEVYRLSFTVCDSMCVSVVTCCV